MSFSIRNSNNFSLSDLSSNALYLQPVAIGWKSGSTTTGNATNTIVLNASREHILSAITQPESFFVSPVRQATQSNVLYYNINSKEITYGTPTGGGAFVPTANEWADYLFWNNNNSQWNVGTDTVRLGRYAGQNNQGTYAVAIGYQAGRNSQHANSIVISASGTSLNTSGSNRLYVDPIRNATFTNVLYYDATNKEITYGSSSSVIETPVYGSQSYTIPAITEFIQFSITFPTPFASKPKVYTTVEVINTQNSSTICTIGNVTQNGFEVYLYNNFSNFVPDTITVNYIATTL